MVVADAPRVIAIDGPAGVGKSSVAHMLAARLGLAVLDTGAMYRALALRALDHGVDPDDRDAVLAAIADAVIDVEPAVAADGVRQLRVILDGAPVEARIRTEAVSNATSRIAVLPEVRTRMVALQRRCGARHGAVVEGRDIGTVVFPDTPYKFFLRADPDVRAQRRRDQLRARGVEVTLEAVQEELARRDARDAGRADAPLTWDETYHVLDTSVLDRDGVVARMLALIAQADDGGG